MERYGEVDPAVVESWLSSLEVSKNTLRNYELGFRTFARFVEERSYRFEELEESHIREFRNYLLEERGLTASATLLYLSAVRSFYRNSESGCFLDITRNVRRPRTSRVHKKSELSISQARELIASFGERPSGEKIARDKAIVSLILNTGMRSIEILSADAGDLSSSDGHAFLAVKVNGSEEVRKAAEIAAPLDSDIRRYLRFRGNIAPTFPLFASTAQRNRGGRLTDRSITRVVKCALKRIGVDDPRYSAHSLRHVAKAFARVFGDDPSALAAALYGSGPVLPTPNEPLTY